MAAATVLYLVHGAEKYHLQARYSLLSLLDQWNRAGRPALALKVYTDRPEALPPHPLIEPVSLDAGFLREAAGPGGYVHRIKLVVLQRAATAVEGPLLYVDCDTRWRAWPSEALVALAQAEAAFMHVHEGVIAAATDPEYHRLLADPAVRGLIGLERREGWPMWNAGTVGVPPQAAAVFAHALAITDALLPRTRRPLFVEQLALSLALDQRFRLRPFDACLDHYWPYSAELPLVLARFFGELPAGLSTDEQAALAGGFNPDREEMERLKRRPAARFRRFRARNLAALEAAWQRLVRRAPPARVP